MEDDDGDVYETLDQLKEKATESMKQFHRCVDQLATIQEKIEEEIDDSICQSVLTARKGAKVWMKDHGLPIETSFQEFFATLLKEHSKEDRLDLSSRSICLNIGAASLFNLEANSIHHILDIILLLPIIFY